MSIEQKNNSQRKIIKMLTNNFDRSNIEKDKISFSAKSSKLLSRSQRTNKLTEYNINYNLLSRISTKQNKKNSNYEISSYKKLNKNDSNNDFLYFLNSYKKNYKNNTTLIKRNLMNNYDKTQELFNNNLNKTIKKEEKENSKERRKRNIYNNKNSLNFQLVSGVSREKLLKLSRNLSKTIINAYNENKE